MKHLSGLDAGFLHAESPEMPMHVGSLHLLELPDGYKGDFVEGVKAHMANRMHLCDVFTRKLALMPFELSNPVWVEDEDVDLDYHVRQISLPRPGRMDQLEKTVGRLHSTLLDRSRPLWEMVVIEGLQGGRAALYSKVHHAGIDGQAGVALANALMDVTRQPREVRPPRARPQTQRYQLGVGELAGAAVTNTIAQYVKIIKTFPDMAQAMRSIVLPQPDGASPLGSPKDFKLIGPKTPFNVSVTNQRSFAARSVPLTEVKQIAKRLGVTLNDVVLSTCSGALRRYLADAGGVPKKSMSAAIPVTLREQGNTASNNQVTMTLMTLASDIKDPLERVRVIHDSSVATKNLMGHVKAAIPTDFPSFGAPWLVSGLASLYGRSRLANVIPPIANVVVSNVPGPQVPLYIAGARLVTYYPVSIPGHGMALNMTVQSYAGSLEYGLIACRRAVPDIGDLGDLVLAEHLEMLALTKALPISSPCAVAEEANDDPLHKGTAQKKKARAVAVHASNEA
ncbi:wax ester/triacylglycerol synthase family O-acyltransferase [Variovorax humicola]|uniref:diacylglycerol O-acyltransferase n=1 Tax=Variovorax humicola TaxID=1769758 RepID=A0ABU8VTC5_9BURK